MPEAWREREEYYHTLKKKNKKMDKLIITPKTKIYDLLEAYPQLEEVLIKAAPQFKKLTNPLLRKTVTRITSLAQAATIGNLKVEELVNKLRENVGQTDISVTSEQSDINFKCPEWFSTEKVASEIDVREMLNRGDHPVHEVLAEVKKLHDDKILKMIAPFNPIPLIEKSISLGYKHWVDKISDEEFFIFFAK
jgi:hypothetical protein